MADDNLTCKYETKDYFQEVSEIEVVNEDSNDRLDCSGENSNISAYSNSDLQGKYNCNECEYKANSSRALQLHNDAVHKGVRYPCQECEYKATQKSSLNRHMKRHSQHL